MLNDAAVAAAEEGRSKLNATPAVYPVTGYVQLDTNGVVKDGAGVVMPGLRKNTYAGPTASRRVSSACSERSSPWSPTASATRWSAGCR